MSKKSENLPVGGIIWVKNPKNYPYAKTHVKKTGFF
jgi:hypothetical protein